MPTHDRMWGAACRMRGTIGRLHAGDAHAEADATLEGFHDDRHRVLVVAQESCRVRRIGCGMLTAKSPRG